MQILRKRRDRKAKQKMDFRRQQNSIIPLLLSFATILFALSTKLSGTSYDRDALLRGCKGCLYLICEQQRAGICRFSVIRQRKLKKGGAKHAPSSSLVLQALRPVRGVTESVYRMNSCSRLRLRLECCIAFKIFPSEGDDSNRCFGALYLHSRKDG